MSKQWQMHQSVQESLCSSLNKDEILEEFINICNYISQEDQKSIKSLNSKIKTIKKHYAQQKCRIEHQFKYIQTLLEQKKKELMSLLSTHEQEIDKTFKNLLEQVTQIQSVINNIQNDILSNRQEIVSEVDDDTFHNILSQFDQEIQMTQKYKKDLLSQKITLIIIEEWTSHHQDVIKNLLNQCITIKDYQKQIETQHSELSASTSSDKFYSSSRSSQELCMKQQTPLIVSFDQKYFLPQKQTEISKSDSDMHDSCESDFLREMTQS
ncbi:unnamed protein product (macronuclear) [Paramecium tetraurelia]|uniref:Uncharacterized protein n=1 Tax=Paramecium tetraurelia TaxID=5888 RepID=A0D8H5_PARTE|nr:uncharacterized protein GSPATT00014288001 [Paramecium tetraurelia]CAK79342.1 unnamed protein product [Paramecium tetraurelia]|eukprot:XP_001446739.1 hypothetical protein (macronuclear) [Paramecium tetraurelia strain d4-2]